MTATPSPAVQNPDSPAPAPWDRFGWVMAVIWLFFLGFPIAELIERDGFARIWGLSTIAAFAVIYTFAFVRFPRINVSQRRQNLTLVALVFLVGLAALVIGSVALTMLPFVTAFGVYFQPARRAIALSAVWTVLAATVVSVTNTWPMMGVVVGIIVLVAVVTFVPRWLDTQQQSYVALRTEFSRIAEQERVARDVHDVLGHSLTVITVKAELAGRLLERAAAGAGDRTILDGAAHEIASIESLSRQALSEIRATVAGLRVARLGEELQSAAEVLAAAGIEVEVVGEVEDMDPRLRLTAGWVLREAVTNVVRHSRAGSCRIEMGERALVVSDDGRGVKRPGFSSGVF